MKYDKILCIPDLHLCFTDFNALKEVKKYADKTKPDLIIQLGDLVDAKAWSRYPKDPSDISASEEFERTVIDMQKLNKLFPEMTILLGNHDRRAIARAAEVGLPKQLVKHLDELFDFEGWTWHTTGKPLIIENIAFIHGDEGYGKPIDKAKMLGKSVVCGHSHQASIEYVTSMDRQLWAMECGAIVDAESMAFKYAATSLKKMTQGFGMVHKGYPVFIPLTAL